MFMISAWTFVIFFALWMDLGAYEVPAWKVAINDLFFYLVGGLSYVYYQKKP